MAHGPLILCTCLKLLYKKCMRYRSLTEFCVDFFHTSKLFLVNLEIIEFSLNYFSFPHSSSQKPTEPPVCTAGPPFKPPPRLPLGMGLKPFENPATSLSLFSGNGFHRNQKIPVPTHTGKMPKSIFCS